MIQRAKLHQKQKTKKPKVAVPSQSAASWADYHRWKLSRVGPETEVAVERLAQEAECSLELESMQRCLDRLKQFVRLNTPYPILEKDVNLLARRGQQLLQAYDLLLQLRVEKTEKRNASEQSRN